MICKRRNLAMWIAWLLTGILVFPLCGGAQSKSRSPSKRGQNTNPEIKKHVEHTARRQSNYRRVSRRYQERLRRRRELARRRSIHLSSGRVTEIQQALAKAGYLTTAPDGHWGPETAQAMKEFQQANGFEATGLPEAKALMKLGLGPHPLPTGLSTAPSSAPSSNSNDSTGSAAPSSSSMGGSAPRDR